MSLPSCFTPLPSCHRWFGFRPEERLLGIVLVHFNFFALRVSDDELSSVHPRHSISLISLKIGDQLLYCGKAARREKLILHYNCNLGFGDRVNAMKMKSCYSAPHYVFRVASLHKILPRFDKLMEGNGRKTAKVKLSWKFETLIDVQSADRDR